MANGFKRFTNTSPLSLKNLNDQLEQLWLKVMGGIKYKDLDNGTRTVIEGKTSEDDVISIIEQNNDQILLAVSKSGGDNLIKNGNCDFGTDSWLGGITNSDTSFSVNNKSVQQIGIRISDASYTFGCEGMGNVDLSVKICAQYTGEVVTSEANVLIEKTFDSSDIFSKHRLNFTVPSGAVTISLRLTTIGNYNVKKIYIREGSNVSDYVSNPNEINGNGICINDSGIDITANKFNLSVKNPSGKLTSVLNAEGGGFNKIMCNNIILNERPYYSSENYITLYVNSVSGNDANSGLSTYEPFKTINRALKAVPLYLLVGCEIRLSGGTYYEPIMLNYGGMGSLTISGQNATLYGCITCHATGYKLVIKDLKIFSYETRGIVATGATSFYKILNCHVDCNKRAGSSGIYVQDGSRAYVENCEVNNCNYALHINLGGDMDVVSCRGSGNNTGLVVSLMAVANVNGTVPHGTTIFSEQSGGRVDGVLVGGKFANNYTNTRPAIVTKTFSPTAMFTYDNGKYLNGKLYQGKSARAMVAFDVNSIYSALNGKSIKCAYLIVSRDNNDRYTNDAIIKCFAHNNKTNGSGYSYVEGYGNLYKIKRNERAKILLPLSFISRLINKTASGIMFHDASNNVEYTMDISTDSSPKLEVQYV